MGIWQKYKLDVLGIGLLLITLPLFFYKLGQSSLVSWDEAWYGEIARNIIKSGQLFNLHWNIESYLDHPPFGFWMIAIGEMLFGYSEFGVRFSSAVFGFLSLIFLYLLGKELFNRIVGFSSAVSLTSSFWFLYRARSGNLDIFLTMLFILTMYLAWISIKRKIFLIPFSLSLTALFLTKTIVPLTILPSIILIFIGSKIGLSDLILPTFLFLTIICTWIVKVKNENSNFLERYLYVGLPGVSVKSSYIDNFKLAKEYLHDGIGRWFWPGVLGSLGSFIIFQKRFYVLGLFIVCFFGPFIFSQKGHIWHLIPLHPFMVLAFFGFSYVVGEFILSRFKFSKYKNYILGSVLIGFSLYLSLNQVRQMWQQFIDIPKYVSDEAILSREAGKYPETFYIDGDFGPAAVFYSEKKVKRITDNDFTELFDKNNLNQESFLLITKQFRLETFAYKNSYQILKSDRDMILILKK